jgi:ferric-dicitrate binding protein FerR (iron transport regulator)
VNVRPYIAWKDGDFVFENESLENIMMRLERWYNVKIFYMNEECKDYRFSGDIERYSDVRRLLYLIQETSNARFEINNQTIVVMAK